MYKYKIYHVRSNCNYAGLALISAISAERANELIKEFKRYDYKNYECSEGYEYVGEDDIVEDLSPDHEGLLLKEIRFSYSPQPKAT